jgi:NAD(P)-dependent dehydrogenase (short-subunit alcohol dehydrogenase family)
VLASENSNLEADPESFAIGGLIKTARHEWPEVSCRILEISEQVDATLLATELLSEGPVETRISSAGVLAHHLVNVPPLTNVPALDLPSRALIVVTGGARGVTAEAALALAASYRPTLLLLGRSPMPDEEPTWLRQLTGEAIIKRALLDHSVDRLTPKQLENDYRGIIAAREIRTNLRRLEAAGATVAYRNADVRDASMMKTAIEHARADFGPVYGIIHGSGVLADKLIADKGDEQFRMVYDTKALGVQALLSATQADPLRFVALFSSSTARFGRNGQCDYAAANEYLNAMARRLNRDRPNCRTVAFNWGPWDSGMVTPALRNIFANEGVGLISGDAGGKFLVAELSEPNPKSEVVVLGPPPDQPARFMLSLDNMPPLFDHVLDGKAALPFALAVNYLAEAAVHRFPDYSLMGFDRLRVLHPIQVPRAGVVSMFARCDSPIRRDGELAVPVKLDVECKIRFQAEMALTAMPAMDCHTALPSIESAQERYGDTLFHGPAWQGISKIVSIDQSSIELVARSAPAIKGWIRDRSVRTWHADPMILDCALQAIIIWTQRRLGLPSLPVAVGRFRLLDRINAGVVNIKVRVTVAKLPMVHADVTVSDAAGSTLAELTDCEFVCMASLKTAFANNRLDSGAGE